MAICKQLLPLLLVLTAFAQEKSGAPAKNGEQIKVIRAGTLIDGSSAQPRHNQVIVVRGNRIEKVLPEQAAEAVPGGPGVEIIDLSRATVSARRALEQGFTTIRDVETEGAGYGDVDIKRAIEQGYIPGPRIFASG